MVNGADRPTDRATGARRRKVGVRSHRLSGGARRSRGVIRARATSTNLGRWRHLWAAGRNARDAGNVARRTIRAPLKYRADPRHDVRHCNWLPPDSQCAARGQESTHAGILHALTHNARHRRDARRPWAASDAYPRVGSAQNRRREAPRAGRASPSRRAPRRRAEGRARQRTNPGRS